MDINITDREKIEQLNTPDIYSVLLFALFKLKEDPKYSTLSELAYLVDYHSLLNLFEYFGGLTIKIPTIEEFKVMLNALILYDKTNIKNIDYNKAIKEFDKTNKEIDEIEKAYVSICTVLNNYEFGDVNEK